MKQHRNNRFWLVTDAHAFFLYLCFRWWRTPFCRSSPPRSHVALTRMHGGCATVSSPTVSLSKSPMSDQNDQDTMWVSDRGGALWSWRRRGGSWTSGLYWGLCRAPRGFPLFCPMRNQDQATSINTVDATTWNHPMSRHDPLLIIPSFLLSHTIIITHNIWRPPSRSWKPPTVAASHVLIILFKS